jgi:hypothetical protein
MNGFRYGKGERFTPEEMERTWREFLGRTCPACGKAKVRMNGFCSRCYFSLPKPIRNRLWNPFGEGYEQAHQEAREWLANQNKHTDGKRS